MVQHKYLIIIENQITILIKFLQLEAQTYFNLQRQKFIFTYLNFSNYKYHAKDVFQNSFHSLNSLIILTEYLKKVASNIFNPENR